jgi:mycothiol synthase
VSFTRRVATPADAQAIAELISDHDAAHNAVADQMSARDVLDWWKRVDEGDTVVVIGEGDQVVGSGTVRRRGDNFIADNFAHPDFRGQGIGTLLAGWAEERAVTAGVAALRVAVAARDTAAKDLLERRGFGYIRSFYRMSIELDAPPQPPLWPEGFTVSKLQTGEEHIVHETLEDAFRDHWDHQTRTFEEWSRHVQLDPSLCYLVRNAEDDAVAAAFCTEERFGVGWVDVLGVRRPWRRHGLGEALLRLAFQALYERGRRRISLGVDAANPTGATRLYERVGMTVSAQDDLYEKPLQPAGPEGGSKLGDS